MLKFTTRPSGQKVVEMVKVGKVVKSGEIEHLQSSPKCICAKVKNHQGERSDSGPRTGSGSGLVKSTQEVVKKVVQSCKKKWQILDRGPAGRVVKKVVTSGNKL